MLASNYKRMLRNTGMLYIRMLLAMVVGLYTSRVVLEALGVEDFGVYHVVAGFVALLGFMQGAMTTATQRYFAFDLGLNSGSNLRSLFNTSVQIHMLLVFFLVLVAETLGYWFVNAKLNIPPDRRSAALFAYHMSVAAFSVSVMTVPLMAMLMANERMGLYALMSMADIMFKLAAVLILPYLNYDLLSLYAAMLFFVSVLTFSGYLLVNRLVFEAVRLELCWRPKNFRGMLSFTAWNTWGNLASALSEHGNNVLLNIFFGPAVTASRSIASQANGALNSLIMSVQAAVNPQIVKSYASGHREEMHKLVGRASKYNVLLLSVIAMPALSYTQQLLDLWLIAPPKYSAFFLQLAIVVSLIDSVSRPLMTSAQATGSVRLYQSVVGGVLLLNVPLSLIAIQLWSAPAAVMWSGILVSIVALFSRLIILRRLTGLEVGDYFKSVLFPGLGVVAVSLIISSIVVFEDAAGWVLILGLGKSFFISTMLVFFLGLNRHERKFVVEAILGFYNKNRR